VDTFPEPGVDVVGYSAKKDGTGEARTADVSARTRVGVIGYWNGEFAVVSSQVFLKEGDADRHADAQWKNPPIRFRMKHGAIIRKNDEIRITGKWPDNWTFHRLYDLGAFCAFLYSELKVGGRDGAADKFRSSLYYAMPGTEAVAMFQRVLTQCQQNFAEGLTPYAQAGLNAALAKCEAWLSQA
jgi:hypothetical protein